MPFIIKLISDNCYIIPDDEDGLTTTESRQEAIKFGSTDDFESADETAQGFSGGMTRGVDYNIESVSISPWHVVQITVPEDIAPKLKGIERFIKNGKANIFLTNTTTANDALDGFTRYGISIGSNALLVTNEQYDKVQGKIKSYLNNRFGEQWEVTLLPVSI